MAGERLSFTSNQSASVEDIDPTDLLFLDSQHTKARALAELTRFGPKVRRWIVMHDTALYGRAGEDGGPGLVDAIREFVAKNPDWFISQHFKEQYGLTILSRDPVDRPKKPIRLWPKGYGPGTEFKEICESVAIAMPNNCTCNALMLQMDEWGPDDCRHQRERIVAQIKANQDKRGWTEKFANLARAGVKAFTTGLAFKVSWTDPDSGLG
jgi:hypothetical protein